MININQKDLIGKGTNRSCYLHPDNNCLCIKITHSNDNSEMIKEIKYYKELEKRNISWEHIAEYHGSVQTTLGKGEVFDLVRDYDGEISKTLLYYIQKEERTASISNPVHLLKYLKEYTLEQLVVVKDLNTKNILVQKSSQNDCKLVLIDGVINNEYIPIGKQFNFFTKKKILRLWKEFEKSLPKKYYFNKYFMNLLNQHL